MNSRVLNKAKIASSILRAGISIDFDNLLAHCEFLGRGLTLERQRFEKLIAKESENLSDEEQDYLGDVYADEAWRLHDVFPSLQATSAFLMAYGMFEKTMNELAREAGVSVGTELKLADLHGQGIERAKNFLSKVCKVESPFKSPEWDAISNFAKLRNVMAHTFGELDLSRQEHRHILSYCKNQQNIKIIHYSPENEFAEVELSLEYVNFAIKSFRKFLIGLCNFHMLGAIR
jgi:hypothetical protein